MTLPPGTPPDAHVCGICGRPIQSLALNVGAWIHVADGDTGEPARFAVHVAVPAEPVAHVAAPDLARQVRAVLAEFDSITDRSSYRFGDSGDASWWAERLANLLRTVERRLEAVEALPDAFLETRDKIRERFSHGDPRGQGRMAAWEEAARRLRVVLAATETVTTPGETPSHDH
jgi:hypothetical protein